MDEIEKQKICYNCKSPISSQTVFCAECGANVKIPKMETSKEYSKESINVSYLNKYERLNNQLKTYQNLENLLKDQEFHYRNIQIELQKSKLNYDRLVNELQNEEGDIEELKNLTWKMLKSRLQGNYEETLKKEETEYFDALNRKEAADKELNELKKRSKQAQLELKKIKELIEKKIQIEQEMNDLIEKACEGVHDEQEELLEQELTNLILEIKPFADEKTQLNLAQTNFIYALEYLNQALKKIGESNISENMEKNPNLLVVDILKKSNLSEGRDLVQKAIRCINESNYIINQTMKKEESELSDVNSFWDRFMKSFVEDLKSLSQPKQTLIDIQKIIKDITVIISWINSRIIETDVQTEELKVKITQKQNDLFQERKKIIEKAIEQKYL